MLRDWIAVFGERALCSASRERPSFGLDACHEALDLGFGGRRQVDEAAAEVP